MTTTRERHIDLDAHRAELLDLLQPIPLEIDPDRHHDEPTGSLDGLLQPISEANLDSPISLLGIIAHLTRRLATPWAVIVVTFKDDPAPSPSLTKYERVFTAAGTGTMNLVDYFSDMSHGMLDLSGSRVFGPYVLDRPRSDYVGNTYPPPTGKLNRNGVFDLAKAVAVTHGVVLSNYAGVVVCGTPQLDLCGWTYGFAALCDDNSLQPSLLGQEMGHGYGLDHSRTNGSDADYQDPWDTMSTANAYMAAHPEYGAVGPGLNASNMSMRNWLDQSRVVTLPGDASAQETITLRPLHARNLSGSLAVSVGQFMVEFRVRSGWDAGIPRSCVLVHRAQGNRSYLMPGTAGHADLVGGDVFEHGLSGGLFGDHLVVHVDTIDEIQQMATVTVRYEPAHRPNIPTLVGDVYGGIAVDGPGFVVINGKVKKIPPRGPARSLIESVMRVLDDESGDGSNQPSARLETLDRVVRAVGDLARTIETVSHTPPGAARLMQQR
ncbi:MAG: hypothetical protein WBM50_19515 [Acidimicrobiales bacterium]